MLARGSTVTRPLQIARHMEEAAAMPTPNTDEAVLLLDGAGRCTDANEAALELLGVSLAELLTSPPDRFAIELSNPADQATLKAEWEEVGRNRSSEQPA